MTLIQVASLSYGFVQDGALTGHPAVIVETGVGHEWSEVISPDDLLARAESLAGGPCLISLAGADGQDAAIQPLEDLILIGQNRGFRFQVEIGGNEAPDWLDYLDYLTVRPAPPSAALVTDYRALHQAIGAGLSGKPAISIAVTVSDDADFAFAEMVHELFPPVDFYVVPASTYPVHVRWLADTVIERRQPDMRLSVPVLISLLGMSARV